MSRSFLKVAWVVAVIDREKIGSTSEKEVGVGGDTPVVGDFNSTLHLNLTRSLLETQRKVVLFLMNIEWKL